MEYVLTGVGHSGNIRLYAFAEVEHDVRRSGLSVAVDIDAVRKHGIPLQELPLLCRLFLEDQREAGSDRSVTYGEAEMIKYATRRADASRAAEQRKAHRKSAANNMENQHELDHSG
jgi:hypothetical protein